jgi:hypothetical protein
MASAMTTPSQLVKGEFHMNKLAAEVIVTELSLAAAVYARVARDNFEAGNLHVATFYQKISAAHYQTDRIARGVETPVSRQAAINKIIDEDPINNWWLEEDAFEGWK